MIRWSCARAEAQLDSRARLTDAERLELEAHISKCTACQGYAAWIDGTRATLRDVGPSFSNAARERILLRAAQPSPPRPPPSVAHRRITFGMGGLGVLGVMGAALYLMFARPNAAPSIAAPSLVWLGAETRHLSGGEACAAAHAVIHANAPSEVRFDATHANVVLASGSLTVEVDPAPRRPFSVSTPAFTVHVLGTGFTVTEDSVRVAHGAVRVELNRQGSVVARLGAGQEWHLPTPSMEPEVVAENDGAAIEAPMPSPEVVAVARVESPRQPVERAEPNALLSRARTALAEGRPNDAARAISTVLRASPTRAQRAEARTLSAELAMLQGAEDQARDLYMEVGRGYPDLAAGDLAFYAAVRLSLRQRDTAAQRALLTEYLNAYPRGRFRRSAERRLVERALQESTP